MRGETVRSMLGAVLVLAGAVAGLAQVVRAQQSPPAPATTPQGAPSTSPSPPPSRPSAPTSAQPPAASPPSSASAAEPPSDNSASAGEKGDEAETPPGTSAPPKPAAAKGSPQRFEPTEKVRPDFDVAFPVDI